MAKYFNYNYILSVALIFICLVAVSGTIVYRFYALNTVGVTIAIALSTILYIALKKLRLTDLATNSAKFSDVRKIDNISIILRVFYLLLIISAFFLLYRSQTDAPIISPWQVVPSAFFILYGLTTLTLFLTIYRQERLTLPLISLHYFLSFSVALVVYKLGYGFDPFIHRATENLISLTGSVDPKPFYYLGQYALITISHKLILLPIAWLDKILVPALSALFLPYYLFKTLNIWLADKKTSLITTTALLGLTFPFLIVTTPQNLAFLFLLLTIIIGLTCCRPAELALIFLLSFAALVTQPIAGIPAFLFASALAVYHLDRKKYKILLFSAIFLLTVIALPVAFYFLERTQFIPADPDASTVTANLSWPKPNFPGQENFILNFIYLYAFNYPYLIALLAAAGALIASRHRRECRITLLYAGMSLALILSYLLARLLPFGFLIGYERSDFPNRLLLSAVFFAWPFLVLPIYRFILDLLRQRRAIKLIFLLFVAIIVSVSLYLSYPRFDHYHNSHIYAVSRADIEVVRWINENAMGEYIVLSNQQVSAAALKEFGFKKYFKAIRQFDTRNSALDIFYYPIPTGGPLYQYYLKMVYEKPDRETMLAAMALVGADEGYFVLNKYWWAFPKILAEAKLTADLFETIDNGEVYVFKYRK